MVAAMAKVLRGWRCASSDAARVALRLLRAPADHAGDLPPQDALLLGSSAAPCPRRLIHTTRFMSSGGKPDVTAKECMAMLKELNVTSERLKRHMNLTDHVLLLLFGITVGALTTVVAQNMSNKEETTKTAEQLTKIKDDLERGQGLLKRTELAVAELKNLVCSGTDESPGSADGVALPQLSDKTPPSSSPDGVALPQLSQDKIPPSSSP